jgi:hypothetical protein
MRLSISLFLLLITSGHAIWVSIGTYYKDPDYANFDPYLAIGSDVGLKLLPFLGIRLNLFDVELADTSRFYAFGIYAGSNAKPIMSYMYPLSLPEIMVYFTPKSQFSPYMLFGFGYCKSEDKHYFFPFSTVNFLFGSGFDLFLEKGKGIYFESTVSHIRHRYTYTDWMGQKKTETITFSPIAIGGGIKVRFSLPGSF